jgi:TonB-dependent SusC/RagA subfamily outer membrane receptor
MFIIALAAAHYAPAQDIFQQKLYPPELALKYREEAGLSAEQVEKIKTIYNSDLPAYNNKKWDLDAAMTKLEQLISQSTIDSKAADAQLNKTLALETEIKKMKLAMLIKIKNMLTPAQQTKLDAHRNEMIVEGTITALLNENQRAVVKIRQNVDPDIKPLYILVNGALKIELDEMPKDINPGDIERIEVLKDDAATSIYGKKGGNGVVIIVLKDKKTN